jgi:hypothetical protein
MDVGRRSATSSRHLPRNEVSENRRASERAIDRSIVRFADGRYSGRTRYSNTTVSDSRAPQKTPIRESPINSAAYGTRLAALATFRSLRANHELQRPRIRAQERKKGQVEARAARRPDDHFLAGRVEGRIIMTGEKRSTGSLARKPRASPSRRASPLPVHMLPPRTHKVTLSIIIYDAYCIALRHQHFIYERVSTRGVGEEESGGEGRRRGGGSAHKRVSQGVS